MIYDIKKPLDSPNIEFIINDCSLLGVYFTRQSVNYIIYIYIYTLQSRNNYSTTNNGTDVGTTCKIL